MNNKKEKFNDIYSDFYSKVKDILIEVPDFNYFHSPTKFSKIDHRFIGRKNIIAKLVSILTNQETRSGTYLVTGYRGMGKTSVVNKAFSQISSTNQPLKKVAKFTKILLTLIIIPIVFEVINYKPLDLFNKQNSGGINLYLFNSFVFLFWMSCLCYLVKSFRIQRKFCYAKLIDKIKYYFFKLSILEFREKSSGRATQFIHELFLITLIYFISLPTSYLLPITIGQSLLTLFFIYILFYTINNTYHKYKKGQKGNEESKNYSKFIGLNFKKSFDNYINFRRNIYININLGHDVIREIDILRIISKSIYNKYRHFTKSLRKNAISTLVKIVITLFITYILINNNTFLNSIETIKNETNSYLYLPTQTGQNQNTFPFNLYSNTIKYLDSLDYNTYEYYSYIVYNCNNSHFDTVTDFNYLKDSIENYLKEYTLYSKTANLVLNDDQIDNNILNINVFTNITNLNKENQSQIESSNFIDYTKLNYFIDRKNDTIKISKTTKKFYLAYNKRQNWKKTLSNICGIIDLYTYSLIYSLNNYVHKTYTPFYHNNIFSLNYFSIILFLLIFLLVRFIFNHISIFGKNSHQKLLKKLEFLIDLIDSQVTLNTGNTGNIQFVPGLKFNKNNSKNRSYKIAGINDIEYLLIEVLSDIEELPSKNVKPEFILVFDELDKIEAKDELINEHNDKTNEFIFSIDSSVKRQQAIYKLLSNLKYFLTTANAKFIFIAGREMYDAYLADVSDRNFFNSSIFNHVIYVKSFLTEQKSNGEFTEEYADVTGLTENYVCQFLFPKDYKEKNYTLRAYNEYLQLSNEFNDNNDNDNDNDNDNNDETKKLVAKQKREKIIYFLHQFIVFLIHNSNGAPKKITSTFERYVINGQRSKNIIKKGDALVVSSNKYHHHLFFDQEDQYKIGMTSSLINPILNFISCKVQNYEDKLLVSTTFLINHLFKFHNYGFSWRNLEYAPEVIEFHKTPEFREFVNSIMHFLKQTHIEEIVSGLYQYKFPKRIAKEISYISKISGESAATYNFTLDDQLLVKQYLIEQLKVLERRYENIQGNGNDYLHVNSIATMHTTLGDIYFYEEDLGQAIRQYFDGLQFIRLKPVKKMQLYEFIVLIRYMLKLGLTFEKRKTNDSAFLIYGELCTAIILYRDINLSSLGLDIRESTNKKSKGEFIFVKEEKMSKIDKKYHHNIKLENSNRKHDPNKDVFIEILDNKITPVKEHILYKITTFEGIRMVYQPFLAKLQVIEKSNLGGITMEDLVRIRSEFEFINKVIRINEKYLIETEFWNKVGDILYYKNGLIQFGTNKMYNNCQNNNTQDCEKCKRCKKIGGKNDINISANKNYNCDYNRINALSNRRKIPCIACSYYNDSLIILIQNAINWTNSEMKAFLCTNTEHKKIVKKVFKELYKTKNTKSIFSDVDNIKFYRLSNNFIYDILKRIGNEKNKPKSIFDLFDNSKFSNDLIILKILYKAIEQKSFTSYRKNTIITIAGLLSNIGDVRICCSNKQDIIQDTTLDSLGKNIDSLTDRESLNHKFNHDYLSKLEAALFYYVLSSYFYKVAKDFKSYSYQMIKIIHVLREYTSWPDEENSIYRTKVQRIKDLRSFIQFVENNLSSKILKSYFGAYENIHTFMVEKFRNTFCNYDDTLTSKSLKNYVSLKKLPIDTEVEELIYAFYHLNLKCANRENQCNESEYSKLLRKLFFSNLASPYLIENNMFNCIIKLRFKEMINYKVLKYFNFKFDEDKENKEKKNEINNLAPIDMKIMDRFFDLFINSMDTDTKDIKYLLSFNLNQGTNQRTSLNGLFEFILSDSIYCLLEVIKKYNIFSQAFIFTHSYIAETHFYLMNWIRLFDQYAIFIDIVNSINKDQKRIKIKIKNFLKNKTNVQLSKSDESLIDNLFKKIEDKNITNNIDFVNNFKIIDKIKNLISPEDWQYISINYQSERVIKEYWEAKETHFEGNAYQILTENMYYLNDDFNDKLFHFRLAQERYRINTDKVDNRIKKAKEFNDKSNLYKIENYIKTRYDL